MNDINTIYDAIIKRYSNGSEGGSQYAPLIVRGTNNPDNKGFVANTGEPTWSEARDAFLSGRIVFISFPNLENENKIVVDMIAMYKESGFDGQSESCLYSYDTAWIDPDFVPIL